MLILRAKTWKQSEESSNPTCFGLFVHAFNEMLQLTLFNAVAGQPYDFLAK